MPRYESEQEAYEAGFNDGGIFHRDVIRQQREALVALEPLLLDAERRAGDATSDVWRPAWRFIPHFHRSATAGDDTCERCGLDIRNVVHHAQRSS